jgi:hypothetical protein
MFVVSLKGVSRRFRDSDLCRFTPEPYEFEVRYFLGVARSQGLLSMIPLAQVVTVKLKNVVVERLIFVEKSSSATGKSNRLDWKEA